MKAIGLATLVLISSCPAFARHGLLPGRALVGGHFMSGHLVSEATARTIGGGAPIIDKIRGEVLRNKDWFEALTQDEIQRHASFRQLRGFYVDYATLQCISAPRASETAKALGTCVAKAHAFQLTADVAVNVSAAGITVQTLGTVVD